VALRRALCGADFGQRLASADFEGGKTSAVKVLEKLGFTIQPRRPAT
jgi:hypothetical protein